MDHSPKKMIASTTVPFAPSERAISNACVVELSSLLSLDLSSFFFFFFFASFLKISYFVASFLRESHEK